MDWNLKSPSLDEGTSFLNMETVDEGSSRFGVYRTKGEFSVDLKLGQVGNVGIESMLYKPKDAAFGDGLSKMESTLASGSSKRARAFNNRNHTVSCLVDGCKADLSNCRDYYRRHKVCELHSKTAQVTISGHKQRFCQQCSRFHSLEEFDEGKRSCRKRLDGHNRRRRRKPQPEPLMRSASFLSNYQGTQLLPFSSAQIYSSPAMVSPAWNGGVLASCVDVRLRSHNQHQQVNFIDKQDLFLGSSPISSYKEGKQITFLQGDHNSNATLNNQNTNLHTLFRTSLTSSVHESPCALSLLSSPQTHNTHGNGLNQMVQPHSSSLMQPLGLTLHDNNSLEPLDSVLNTNGSDASQLFPFEWE